MSDTGNVAKSIRERLGGNTEERLGKALSELLENPLLTGALGRAFDAREKASQAQEVAMGALNIPSAADIERLTRRLRAVSHRLEGIEDGVDRLDRALTPSGVEARLATIESQLTVLTEKLDRAIARPAAPAPRAGTGAASRSSGSAKPRRAASPSSTKAARAKQVRAAKEAKAKHGGSTTKATKAAKAAKAPAARSRAGRAAPGKS